MSSMSSQEASSKEQGARNMNQRSEISRLRQDYGAPTEVRKRQFIRIAKSTLLRQGFGGQVEQGARARRQKTRRPTTQHTKS